MISARARRTARVLLCLFFCAFVSIGAAQAEHSNYVVGVKLYGEGRYDAAAGFFQQTVKLDPAHIHARYYLANCLVKLNQYNSAIAQYCECFRLDPSGPQAKHCLDAVHSLREHMQQARSGIGTGRRGSVRAGDSGASAGAGASSEDVASSGSRMPDSSVNLDDSEIEKRLPKIAPFTAQGEVTYSDVVSWGRFRRLRYVQYGHQRVEQASSKVEEARQMLQNAENILKSFVPGRPNFGESHDDFLKRKAAQEDKMAALMEPYQKELQNRQNILQDAKEILRVCEEGGE